MTTSDLLAARATEAFAWVWLPGSTDPVVAGRLRSADGRHAFIYARSYLDRPDAISLYGPELPLRRGWIDPPDGLQMAGCLSDASPDSWGQRVIDVRLAGGRYGDAADLVTASKLTYLLESGSDRIGALDFQRSATEYVPRVEDASLDELHAAAEALQQGELSAVLSDAFVHGTAVGGARPKVLVRDEATQWIAKLSTSSDPYPVVKAEAVAMALATHVGLDVAHTSVTTSLGRDVLLVERFDRPGGGRRRLMISALTMLEFGDFLGARYSSYLEVLDVLRRHGRDGDTAGRTLFERIVFNIAVGNTDDHARNHAAFWDGRELELTPAYDLCPQLRNGTEARQAMDITADGRRDSRFALCVSAAASYGLSPQQASEIVDQQVSAIRDGWEQAADQTRLTADERQYLWGRQILNPYAFEIHS
ncbi:type II toxin-antitoxin system HipA family toxin [Angustibacter sp. McL0619]|uniref:type II toxin-antitoxin system HipA family toxin n=1 Tax=Angustibacter sp. McL0619 TaxID=3415676 RepID=UPI003CFA8D63